jgi:hypothetical protein
MVMAKILLALPIWFLILFMYSTRSMAKRILIVDSTRQNVFAVQHSFDDARRLVMYYFPSVF